MLEIRILGPVEVLRDGRALPLGGAKQRALVADLTLHPNEVVSADRLIDDLWGDEPPDTAAHMLHVYVSRLRKTLEDHGRMVLETRPPGYVLNLDPQDDLDAARFESRIREGRSALDARPAEALATFDEALGWWRGRALEEFAHEAFAQPAAARLEELRQATQEGRVEALLALGRHEEALGELEALIARFPLRERPRELQMLALYRSGRQGEALQAFQSARKTLAEELGVDPGPALVSLEQAILRHDAELDAPARGPRTGVVEGGPPSRRAGRRLAWVATAAAAALVGILLIVVLTLDVEEEEPPIPPGEPNGDGIEGTIHWTEVPGPAGAFLGGAGDQVILGATATPVGLMAVGFTAAERAAEGPRDYDAAVWLEDLDGVWRLVDDPAFAAQGNQRATDALAIEGRLVVVGTDQSSGDFDAAVWRLDDGATSWIRVSPEARGMDEPGDQGLRASTWTGSRIVAVGYTRGRGDEDAAIWLSRDASDWTFLTPTNLGEPGDQQMSTVTTTLDGLTVVGGYSESSGNRNAAIWISPDLLGWERVTDIDLGGEGDQQINAIIAGGPGLVAVGQETVDDDQDAVVWTSVDGVEWERVEDPAGSLGGVGLQQMSAVTFSEGTFVAAGTEKVDRETDGAVWTSLDAMTWTRLPATAIETAAFTESGRGEGVRDLLVDGDRFVALGREWRGGDDDADVWIGRLER